MKLLNLLLISSILVGCGSEVSNSSIDPVGKQVIITEKMDIKPKYMIYKDGYLYTDKCFKTSKQAHEYIINQNKSGKFIVQEVKACR